MSNQEMILKIESGVIIPFSYSGYPDFKGEGERPQVSVGGSYFTFDGWTVEVIRHTANPCIKTFLFDSSTGRKTNRHWSKLKDGVLQISYGPNSKKPLVKFHRARVSSLQVEHFGIDEVIFSTPNVERTDCWNPQGNATGTVALTWLVTDGTHVVSGYNGKLQASIEHLKRACSEVKHKVTDANWTVVCSVEKNDDKFVRKTVLFTEEDNSFMLCRLLEEYLEQNEKYARFEDIVEEFMAD